MKQAIAPKWLVLALSFVLVGLPGDADARARPAAQEAPRAAVGEAERLAKLFRKMIETGDDALMGDERFDEGEPRCVVWCGKEGVTRLLAAAKRLVEAREHGFGSLARMEPPLEQSARQIVELANALQAEALEKPCDLTVEAQGLYGKRRERFPDFPMRDDDGRGMRVAGERMSAA